MKHLFWYLFPWLLLVGACSKSKDVKVLYPSKLQVGNLEYKFHYNHDRLYSITSVHKNIHGTFTYTYYDDYFKEPDHPSKNEIFEMSYAPDKNITGWDSRDSVISKQVMYQGDLATGLILREHQNVYFYRKMTSTQDNSNDLVRHTYNKENQLVESGYYTLNRAYDPIDTVGILTKRITYGYDKEKLVKVSYLPPNIAQPYLVIEVAYDNKPGFLRNIPAEARFLPLELPYRKHNIVSYKVTDGQGKLRKDLSYTCTYTYNRNNYPNTFTPKMLNGQQIKGYIVYNTKSQSASNVALAR